jgi:hypothetical protein
MAKHDLRCMQLVDSACKDIQSVTHYLLQQHQQQQYTIISRFFGFAGGSLLQKGLVQHQGKSLTGSGPSSSPTVTVVDGLELSCGPGINLEKAETAARVAWISDPVHPSGHTFAKMALNLFEAMAPTGKLATSTGRKRKHSDSDAGEISGAGSRSEERARVWSDPRRGGHHQPTPRHNNGHHDRNSAARGRGNGGGGHFQPNLISGNYRGREYGGGGGGDGFRGGCRGGGRRF